MLLDFHNGLVAPSIDYSFQKPSTSTKTQFHYVEQFTEIMHMKHKKKPEVRKTDSQRQIRQCGREAAAWPGVMKENKWSLIGVERSLWSDSQTATSLFISLCRQDTHQVSQAQFHLLLLLPLNLNYSSQESKAAL